MLLDPTFAFVIPSDFRDIICYKHMTLPNAANVLTLDGAGAKNVVVDT